MARPHLRRDLARAAALLPILLAPACAGEPASNAEDDPGVGVQEDAAPVRTLEAVRPDGDDLRILVYHDMEGLSGQADPNTFRFAHSERYAAGREYLMGDLNAVIEGLVAGGADVVHVVDGHGSGNPEPDVMRDRLHPAAELVSRDEPFDAYTGLVEGSDYDAVAVVGMHAKTGSGGFASHTFTLGIAMHLNGMPVTETELVGYSWGRAGVPVIFASGDDRLRADLEEPMPWLEFVQVKTATSASTADPRPVDEARADLADGARRAVERLLAGEMSAQRLSEPVVATLAAVPPADVSVLEGVPGIDHADGAVTFEARDFQGAYDGLVALVNVARTGYSSVMAETARQHVGPEFGARYADALFDRWLDYESGRWAPPAAATSPEAPRTWHGYR
jgi:D-amino peptidase